MKTLVAALLFLLCSIVDAYPSRIVSTMPNVTEILFALNLGDRVVAVTQNCNYPKQAQEKIKIGRETINLEKIISLKPDLVIMLEDAQKREIDKMKTQSIPILTINPHTVPEVMDSIVKIGEATGKKEEAQKMVEQMKRRIGIVESRILPWTIKKLFITVGYRPLIGAGGHTFLNDIIYLAGGENIIEKLRSPYPEINFEELARLDPNIIIVPIGMISKKEINSDQRWMRLKAVKNGKIMFIDGDILFRPGPRVVDAIEQIAKFINNE